MREALARELLGERRSNMVALGVVDADPPAGRPLPSTMICSGVRTCARPASAPAIGSMRQRVEPSFAQRDRSRG